MTYKSYFLILALLLCTTIACVQYNQVNDIAYRDAAQEYDHDAMPLPAYKVKSHSNKIVAEGEVPVRLADSYSFTEGPVAFYRARPKDACYRRDARRVERMVKLRY